MSTLQTIYIQNIQEKIKLEELKEALFLVFTTHCGPILQVSCRKSNKYRGQAWITFVDVSSATKAVNTMNDFKFYGKPLKITFSKNKADVVAKADGTFVPREKKTEEVNVEKKRKLDQDDTEEDSPQTKVARTSNTSEATDISSENPPNSSLFVSGLPEKVTPLMVENLFKQTAGFKKARLLENLPGVAFVEFDSIDSATLAMNTFQNYKLNSSEVLRITYSK